ncbi:hypothetical protein PHLCEN_2v10774 [Hermanssonia centrifuga]|uniref:DUF1742-domain-containing protein n=1 Tax=Hermanssonia centrifuga TaxID=98765 RepID=A0A2R6NM84_9APHY|nr:hypothetical protein PHLCEN_2v10774 [Hermanssonia centrifuga]
MSFTNLYYKRAVGTPRDCYVCYKPTTTVLATINTVDFIYTCEGHLSDPEFATQIGESSDGAGGARKMGLSPEEIAKVKEEWEERQKKKQEKAKEQDRGKKEGDAEAKTEDKDETKKSPPPSKSPASPSGSSTPNTPTHQRYTLHRDIFSMRLGEHRKRKQTAQARALAPLLPGAPRSPLPFS